MNATLEYPYRPNARTMGLAIVFFAAAGAVLANTAATNQRELILNGFLHLSVAGATRFYAGLAIAAGLFVVAGVAGLVSGRRTPRFVRLTPTELTAPRSVFAKQPTVIPLANIQGVDVQAIKRQRMLHVYHTQGSLTVMQSMLPIPADFDALHAALLSNLESLSVQSRPVAQR
jgi:hypothetical protein